MTALSTSVVGLDGAEPAFIASANGDTAVTGAGVTLLVNNTSGASVTVTLVTPGQVNGLGIDDRIVTVSAGKIRAIPLGRDYTNPSTGRATINYSAPGATVTVAVIRVAV